MSSASVVSYSERLTDKIQAKTARVGIVGLGYVGLPLAMEFAKAGFAVTGIEARFIELAGYISGQMPHFVAEKIQNALNGCAKALKNSRVHILGVAYKRDIDDVRESPALDIMHLLARKRARVACSDPYVPSLRVGGAGECVSEDAESAAAEADCVAIATDHARIDYAAIARKSRLVVDTRNALKGVDAPNIVRL
jgi:UDP-N-acetyl-D-glucosamine dehydrogenase